MADFAVQPVDYSQLANSVPNPLAQQATMAQIENQRIAGQQAQQQMAMQRIALQRQLMFGNDLGNYIKNPTSQGLATLFGKYPEFDKQASEARGALNTGDITELGSAASLAAKGQYDDAARIVEDRIAAEKAAGTDTTQSQQVLDLLKSGDPQKQRAALGMLSLGVAVAVGPDKAADFLKANGLSSEPVAVGMDQRLINPATGEQMVGAAPKLEAVVTNNADGSQTATPFNPYTGEHGAAAIQGSGAAPAADGAATAPTATPAGPQGAIAHVLRNEGGYNPKDANGSPTNYGINYKANAPLLAKMGITAANFKNMTQAQAEQVYAAKYWPKSGAANLPANLQAPYFDVYVRNPAIAKKALAASGGDPAKFMQLSTQYLAPFLQKHPEYTKAYGVRDARNTAIALGGTSAATGAPANADPASFGGSPTGALNTKEAPPGYAWNATHTGVVPIPGSEVDPNSNNPQEVEDLARNWLITGAWGSGGGMGGGNIPAPLKKQAMARASQIMQSVGITADKLPEMRSQYAADRTSLNNINGTLSGLQASENALKANAQQVLQTQQQLVKDGIIDNGSPLLNDARLGTYKHLGSGETKAHIKAYEDAMNAYAVEYAKFMSSANGIGGSAAPSDSSQEQARDLNDTSMGPAATISHIRQTLIEAENRRKGIASQAQILQQRLSSYLTPHGQTAQHGAAQIHTVEQYRGLPHGAHYIDPDGNYRIKP